LLIAGISNAEIGIGDLAPDFTLSDVETGEMVSLSDFRGQVVVLRIWKICKGQCRAAVPHFRRLQTKLNMEYSSLGDSLDLESAPQVKILSVNAINPKRRIMTEKNKFDMDYQILVGRGSGITSLYQTVVLPQVYVIDAEGIIQFIGMYPNYDELLNVVKPLMDRLLEE